MSGQGGGRVRLLELVLDLMIFTVCGVICLLLLSGANKISVESARLTRGVELSQNAAQRWKATGEIPADAHTEGYTVRVIPAGAGVDVRVSYDGADIYAIEGVRRFA